MKHPVTQKMLERMQQRRGRALELPKILDLGRIVIDETTKTITKDGKVAEGLTRFDFEVIDYLAKRPGVVCSYEEIIKNVTDGANMSEPAFRTRMNRLRERFEGKYLPSKSHYPEIIKSSRGRGYYFSVPEQSKIS